MASAGEGGAGAGGRAGSDRAAGRGRRARDGGSPSGWVLGADGDPVAFSVRHARLPGLKVAPRSGNPPTIDQAVRNEILGDHCDRAACGSGDHARSSRLLTDGLCRDGQPLGEALRSPADSATRNVNSSRWATWGRDVGTGRQVSETEPVDRAPRAPRATVACEIGLVYESTSARHSPGIAECEVQFWCRATHGVEERLRFG